jgi:YfiH family protein
VKSAAEDWLDPAAGAGWPAGVGACMTTRSGGSSGGAFAFMDLGGSRDAQGRVEAPVRRNREHLRHALDLDEICFVEQVHGRDVHRLEPGAKMPCVPPRADAVVVTRPDVAAAVLVADCLPVLMVHEGGRVVAAAHAGWRGLASGVLEATLTAMQVPPGEVFVWLGPAIGPEAFEVGPEVRAAFLDVAGPGEEGRRIAAAFGPGRDDRWHADLWALARARLGAAGVKRVDGGGIDVHADARRFYSYRRDAGVTGRQAALVWFSPRCSRS